MVAIKKYGSRGPPSPPQTPRKPSKMARNFPRIAADIQTAASVARAVAQPSAANIMKAAMAARKSYTTRYTQTKRAMPYRSDSSKYTSAGKFNKRRKVDVFRKYTTRGVVNTKEMGGVVTGLAARPGYPVYVGHATHGNTQLMMRLFCRAIVRDIFYKHGVTIQDMELESPGNFTLRAYVTVQSATFAQSPITVTTTGKSYIQIANEFFDTLVNNFFQTTAAVVPAYQDAYFTLIELKDVADTLVLASLELADATISFKCKSDLKIQNRTLAPVEDTDKDVKDNVSNQPLYGKFYSGKGNGLVCRIREVGSNNFKKLLVSATSGFGGTVLTNTQDFWLREPPLPSTFLGLPKYGKVSIEPGTVKTSSLVHTFTISQRSFWTTIIKNNPTDNVGSAVAQSRYGKFYYMALEKMICSSNTETPPVLGYELNQRMGCMLTYKRQRSNIEFIEDSSYQNIG